MLAAKSAIETHNKTKRARVVLCAVLGNLNEAIAGHSEYTGPIFIFVDELNRCRLPGYKI